MWIIAMGLAAGAFAAPAFAQDAPAAPSSPAVPPGATAAVCTSAGVDYQVGEFACIPACHGQRRLARCDAISTRASWTYVSEACPSAMINAPWPSDWSETPVAAEMSPVPVAVNMSAIDPAIAPLIGSHYRQSVLTRQGG
jgi:hypothetical protein